jgi:hypothetical protein
MNAIGTALAVALVPIFLAGFLALGLLWDLWVAATRPRAAC